MLEQVLYGTREAEENREEYRTRNLEQLSATQFYIGISGSRPLSLGGGSRPLDASKGIIDRQTTLSEYGVGKSSRPLFEVGPMKPTETFVLNLDEVFQGLRLIDKYHPPTPEHSTISYEQIFGVKGIKIDTTVIDNILKRLKIK